MDSLCIQYRDAVAAAAFWSSILANVAGDTTAAQQNLDTTNARITELEAQLRAAGINPGDCL